MTCKLFLDDVRNPREDGWVVVRSFFEAANYVKQHGFPDHVNFDYYLGDDDHRTGRHFAQWLIDYDKRYGTMPDHFTYDVHSADPTGAANIRVLLDSYIKQRVLPNTV